MAEDFFANAIAEPAGAPEPVVPDRDFFSEVIGGPEPDPLEVTAPVAPDVDFFSQAIQEPAPIPEPPPQPTQISPVAQRLRDDNIGKLPTLGRVAPPPEPVAPVQEVAQAEPEFTEPRGPVEDRAPLDLPSPAVEGLKQAGRSALSLVGKFAGEKGRGLLGFLNKGAQTAPGADRAASTLNVWRDSLKESSGFEKKAVDELERSYRETLKSAGSWTASAQKVGEGVFDVAANLMLIKGATGALPGQLTAGVSSSTRIGKWAQAATRTLKHAAKVAALKYATTPGDDKARAESATTSFLYMATPALSAGLPTDTLARTVDFALNSGISLSKGIYQDAFKQAQQLADEEGGSVNSKLFRTLTPAMVSDLLFSLGTKSATARGLTPQVTKDVQDIDKALAELFPEKPVSREQANPRAKVTAETVNKPDIEIGKPLEEVKPVDEIPKPVSEEAKLEAQLTEKVDEGRAFDEARNLSKMTTPEIRKVAAESGLKSDGNRNDLIDRITGVTAEKVGAKKAIRISTGVQKVRNDVLTNERDLLKLRLQAEARGSKVGARSAKSEAAQNRRIERKVERESATLERKVNRVVGQLKRLSEIGEPSVPAEYKEQINALLDKFNLTTKTKTAKRVEGEVKELESMRQFVERQKEAGEVIPDIVLDRMDELQQVDVKTLTLEDMTDIRDQARMIAHLGRTKNKLIARGKLRDFKEAEDSVVNTALKTGGIKEADVTPEGFQSRAANAPTRIQKAKNLLGSFTGSLRKVPFINNTLDNFKTNGKVFQGIDKPINDASSEKLVRTKEIMDVYQQAGRELIGTKKALKDFTKSVVDIGGEKMSKEEALGIYLNSRHQDNRDSLTSGNKLSDETIDAVEKFVEADPKMKRWADRMLKLVTAEWESSKKVAKALTGVTPGEIKGVYFPKIADPLLSKQAGFQLAQKDLMQDIFDKTFVNRGFTKARKGGRQPLNLNVFETIPKHISDVTHFNTHALPVRDVQKIIGGSRFRNAVSSVMGENIYNQYAPWLRSIANPKSARDGDKGAKLFGLLRRNSTAAMLGLKTSVALMQPGSIFQTIKEVGLRDTLEGVSEFYDNPVDMAKFINEKSPEMLFRGQSFDREIQDFENAKWVDKLTNGNINAKEAFFGMIQAMDKAATYPSWLAAYNKALGENKSEAQAIDAADSVVVRTQPSGSMKNMAEISKGSEFKKLWTMFYSHFSNVQNQLAQTADYARLSSDHPLKKTGNLASNYWWLLIAPVLYSEWAKKGFGKAPSAAQTGKGLVSYATGGIPIARDLVSGYNFGGKLSAPPALRAGQLGLDTIREIKQGDTRDAVERGTKTAGTLAGIPTEQAWITINGIQDLITEETDDPRRALFSKFALEQGEK